MLEKWVNQNSGSHNLAGVEAVGRDGSRPSLSRSASVCAGSRLPANRTRGASGRDAPPGAKAGRKRLLLIGHLDTVFFSIIYLPFSAGCATASTRQWPGRCRTTRAAML